MIGGQLSATVRKVNFLINLESYLLTEGVRAIEGDSPALSMQPSKLMQPSKQDKLSFQALILQRTSLLDKQLQIKPLFTHFKRISKNLFNLFALLFTLLGASSVLHLLFSGDNSQINFFWVFALFFIPNLLAFLLWGLFFLRSSLLNGGWLARSSLFLLRKFEQVFNLQSSDHPHFWVLFKSYFKITLSGRLGVYQLSCLTHLIWFCYFSGATLMLLLMLATHQVDFIWQSSILSADTFLWLTQVLAFVPDLLGLVVPSASQIELSHIGNISSSPEMRLAWSSLLLSSLILYGLLPRLLLLLLMRFLFVIKSKQLKLDLSSSYYVQLRLSLKPNISTLGVIDPDQQSVCFDSELEARKESNRLPALFYPVAVELSEKQFVAVKNLLHVDPAKQLLNSCDFKSQQAVLANISTVRSAIVIYVALSRLPDRGLLSFIRSLTDKNSQLFYLLLVDEHLTATVEKKTRRSDWYRLAQKANISLDNILELKVTE